MKKKVMDNQRKSQVTMNKTKITRNRSLASKKASRTEACSRKTRWSLRKKMKTLMRMKVTKIIFSIKRIKRRKSKAHHLSKLMVATKVWCLGNVDVHRKKLNSNKKDSKSV